MRSKTKAIEQVRQWVSDIRDVAYDAEDAIETFLLTGPEIDNENRRGFMDLLKGCACFLDKQATVYGIGTEIEDIKNRILNLSRSIETFGIRDVNNLGWTSNAHQRLRDLRRSSPRPQEDHVVGLEDDAKAIALQLLKEEPSRIVISIVGMGGLGKTSLARKVYNLDDIRRLFDCYAWVYVSSEYKIKDVLQRLIKSFKTLTKDELEILDKLTEEDLEDQLHELLERRRYLVVIDDVWGIEAWVSLKRALPDGKNGSRVILTTRNINVAPAGANKGSHIHKLRFLNEEEGWELLCRKAFPSFYNNFGANMNYGISPNLESLGREMLRRCGGLPLAIVVLGGLLFTKTPEEWQTVHDNIGRELREDQIYQLSEILALSYKDLPYQLKPCFLYLGVFPEDYEIDTRRLIRLWIAEGFIPQQEGRMEDVGDGYLNELINRSMIQVAARSWSQRISRCRIHDLLRDLSLSKAKAENFLDVYQRNTNNACISTISRRHVAHSGIIRYFPLKHYNQRVRSLLLFNPDRVFPVAYHSNFSFKVLRVLDLTNISFLSHFPDEIGNLIHLRYLGVVDTDVSALPASIGNLVMLQTLHLRFSGRSNLPDVLWKMKRLRYIRAHVREHLGLDTLEELQSLKKINADIWMKICSVNLKSLRKLKVVEILSSHGEAIFDSIARHSSSLQSLSLIAKDDLKLSPMTSAVHKGSFPTLAPLSRCYNLYKLTLVGKVERLPDSLHEFPPKLTTLKLVHTRMRQDPMPLLSTLPNLTRLCLAKHSYVGREIVCSRKGFPQLQALLLEWLFELEQWTVEDSAMPNLRVLFIGGCNNMRMVPEGLRFLTTLEEFQITNMPVEFTRRIKEEDKHKLEHVPSIKLN